MSDRAHRCTASGRPPVAGPDSPVPDTAQRPDGQHVDHWVLCPEDSAPVFVRPVRTSYKHVGLPGPRYPLRNLTADEQERYADAGYVKFEPYPESDLPATGRFWTQARLDGVGKGCGSVTTMGRVIAETYARAPGFYGSTFCAGCRTYLPVGTDGEFVWLYTEERVGT